MWAEGDGDGKGEGEGKGEGHGRSMKHACAHVCDKVGERPYPLFPLARCAAAIFWVRANILVNAALGHARAALCGAHCLLWEFFVKCLKICSFLVRKSLNIQVLGGQGCAVVILCDWPLNTESTVSTTEKSRTL